MTTYYVDPAAGGANNGTDWTNAWVSLQTAADTAAAGDTVYCRGEQDISAAIDFDTNSGSYTNGFIKFIGCNASGNVDGTRFVVDVQENNVNGIALAKNLLWFENIEVKNVGGTTKDGWITSAAASGVFLSNCAANNCNQCGIQLTVNGTHIFLYRCVAYNTGYGIVLNGYYQRALFCCARDNSVSGFSSYSGSSSDFIGCVAHNNLVGFDAIRTADLVFNCVSDANTSKGISGFAETVAFPSGFIIGSRITNHSGTGDIGIDMTTDIYLTAYNYFENNANDNMQNATLHYPIPVEDGTTTTNIEDQSNTNQGYVDPANHDFSTGYTDSGDPDLRRTAITVPWS